MARTDQRDLRSALRTIRETVPTAVSADFQTSDQNSYGFVLNEVNLADGTMFSDIDLKGFEALMDAVEQFINDISWGGVMNDDRGGAATITIPPASDFTEEETAENDYMADLLSLIDAFNYERCEVCGNDLNKHTIGPDPLGKPHLFCLSEPA